MSVKREAWYREASKESILRYLSDPVPFRDLPPHYQESIKEYTLEGIGEGEGLQKHLAKYRFRFGDVPTEVLTTEIQRVRAERGEGDPDFDEYHRWYVEQGHMPDHGPHDRWPVSLSPYYEDEVLQDGWHRFHDYYRKGHETIPVVEWVKVR